MRENAPKYVGKHLAMISEGRLLTAPHVNGALGRQLIIAGGTEALPERDVPVLIDRINALVAQRR